MTLVGIALSNGIANYLVLVQLDFATECIAHIRGHSPTNGDVEME